MNISDLKVIYARPALRLSKIIALAILWDRLKELGLSDNVRVVMMPENLQRSGEGIYHLDSHGNGYRERGGTEVSVVMEDFSIPATPERKNFTELVAQNNVRANYAPQIPGQTQQRSTRGILNRYYGSVGFFTGFAWEIINNVTSGNWRWSEEPKIDDEGSLVLDTDEKPIFVKSASRNALTPNDFLWMSVDVIMTALEMMRVREAGHAYAWGEGLKTKTIKNLLESKFQGKKVVSGGYEIPTLCRYVRDLYELGQPVKDIQKRLRPWLRLWRITERLLEEGKKTQPDHRFQIGSGYGVMFDSQLNPRQEPNPLVHTAQLNSRSANFVGIRRASGHVALFFQGVDKATMAATAEELKRWEPGKWTYEDGYVVVNGSLSRPDTAPTNLPFIGNDEGAIEKIVKRNVRLVLQHRKMPQRRQTAKV